ncbi:hypothetical protein ABZ128_33920 [Streptomyces sp. NPDC006326]|uniref:hypothetical protein n=1 Tax=Streptomyces sp. NPDC006326 TaxID=3156752 RepID=UPI0033A8EB0A
MNEHPAPDASPASTPPPDSPQAPHRRAFVAPLVSTLVTLPAALVSFFIVGLSPMACDSCNGAVADRFDASYEVAFSVFTAGLLVVLVLLVACWALPWQRRNAARRVVLALCAPAAVVLDYLVFAALVDWPS